MPLRPSPAPREPTNLDQPLTMRDLLAILPSISRAVVEKTQDKSAGHHLQNGTIIGEADPLGAVRYFDVHIDGDPDEQTILIPGLSAGITFPGQRCIIMFTPPHGAVMLAFEGVDTPLARVSNASFLSSYSDGSLNTLVWSCIEGQTVMDYDAATGAFTALANGIYAVTCTLPVIVTSGGGNALAQLFLGVYDADDVLFDFVAYDQTPITTLSGQAFVLHAQTVTAQLLTSWSVRAHLVGSTSGGTVTATAVGSPNPFVVTRGIFDIAYQGTGVMEPCEGNPCA